jgi:hypothetical protein
MSFFASRYDRKEAVLGQKKRGSWGEVLFLDDQEKLTLIHSIMHLIYR